MIQFFKAIKIILFKAIGFLVFIILLGFANLLNLIITNPFYGSIVTFLNSNFLLIIFMGILFMIAQLFGTLFFPLNLPQPVFSATASLFLAIFLLRLFKIFVNDLYLKVAEFDTMIYSIVFVAVLIFGYVFLFIKLTKD